MICIRRPQNMHEWQQARELVKAYVASLDIDLTFQNIESEMKNLEQDYDEPKGAFFIAYYDEKPLGCVGLRCFGDGIGEIKRLYVMAEGRGLGLGKCLMQAAIDTAKEQSFVKLVLDTLPEMKSAQNLYRALGFTLIPAYCYNPFAGALFFERILSNHC